MQPITDIKSVRTPPDRPFSGGVPWNIAAGYSSNRAVNDRLLKEVFMSTSKARGASVLLGLLATLPLGAVMAESSAPQHDASIAFANHGGIWNWEADRERGLWVQ